MDNDLVKGSEILVKVEEQRQQAKDVEDRIIKQMAIERLEEFQLNKWTDGRDFPDHDVYLSMNLYPIRCRYSNEPDESGDFTSCPNQHIVAPPLNPDYVPGTSPTSEYHKSFNKMLRAEVIAELQASLSKWGWGSKVEWDGWGDPWCYAYCPFHKDLEGKE